MDARAKRLWDLYRLTPADYDAIVAYEAEHFPLLLGPGRRNVDHRHRDGLVRGILDWRINKGAGLIEMAVSPTELPRVFQELSWFYTHPPAVTVLGPRYGLIGQAKYKKKMVYGGGE